MKYVIITGFTVVTLIVLAGVAYSFLVSTEPAKAEPEILSFVVEDSEFVITSRYVDSVIVFGAPRYANKETSGDLEIGRPTGESQNQGLATWRLPVPAEPLSVSVIYAQGYDQNGEKVAQRSLATTGYRNLLEALWLDDGLTLAGGELVVTADQSGRVENLEVSLIEVVRDTRCRSGEDCRDSGQVTVELEVVNTETEDAEAFQLTLSGPDGINQKVGNYLFRLVSVAPERPSEGELGLADYEITLLAFKESKQ